MYRRSGPINKDKLQYNNLKLTAHVFNTYFLTITDKMNSDTRTLMTEDTTKNLTAVIPKTLPNINLIPTSN
jgi:hypothetical protein